jgi:hypothetical protein
MNAVATVRTSPEPTNTQAAAPRNAVQQRDLPEAGKAQSFLLTRVQPALSGLMDGSLSTLAPWT